jgi:hypothetical protein
MTPGALSVNGPVSLTTLSGNLNINDLLTASDRITLQASGDVNLGSGASISSTASSDAIVVAAGGNFSNFAGSDALTAVYGRRLIYSSDPALDNRGGLSYDFKQYGQAYRGNAYVGPGLGNGFLYSTTPTITPGLTGTITKTYDGTVDAVLTASNFATSGAIDNDVIALNPVIGAYNSKDVVQASSVWVDGLSIASSTNSTGNVPVYGYQLGLNSAYGSGSIAAKSLSISGTSAADKTYDGTTTASINLGTLSGLIGSETLGVTASGSFESKNAGVRTATATYALADDSSSGGLASNYVLAPTQNLSGFITRRPVSTWSGLSSGLWSDPANWDALPSAANVAAVLIPTGTAAVSYDAAAGSTQLQSLTNNQSLSLDAGSLTVGGTTSVGPGATLSLNAGGFTTAALSNAGLVNGSGALLLDGLYSESASGRLGSGFSRVEITQTSGLLSLRSIGASGPVTLTSSDGPLTLNGAISSAGAPITLLASGPLSLRSGASLTSAGGTLSLFGFGPLELQGASLNASGAATGGTVQLNGPSIALDGTSVNTSGAADGGTIRIGSILLAGSSSLPTVLPSTVSIRNSSLVADPPALGGSINVNGAAISVSGSSFNVVGSSGGSITIGSAATASLSLDALTSLLGGGGASFGFSASDLANSASTSGGVLSFNGPRYQSSKPLAPVLEVVISQQTFNPPQLVQNETNAVGTAPISPLGSQPVAPAGEQLVSVKLTDSFSLIDSTDTAVSPQPTQKHASPTQTSSQAQDENQARTKTQEEKKNQLEDTIARPEAEPEASPSAKPSQQATADPQAGSNAAANPAATSSGNQTAALAAQSAQQLSNQQVTAQYTAGEQKTAETTATKLGLTTGGGTGTGFKVPTPAQIQAGLRQVIDAIRQQFSP